ncbi:response regulator [Sphingobacterium cellulitidis]|uniref:response regulator n=1 Tax=Sphingobacterium cellulitidis TaxID=1768011 RepID=UPI000B940B65|nr:response regulator [Sphingobacterium cellulitidis]OYD45447.1 response regulator [Sphingobacterium cellulitidis]
MSILIIDDDKRNIFALKTALRSRGYDAQGVITAQEGLDILEGGSGISVVLLDMMMPEFDGFQFLKHIRVSLGKDYPPVIAVTAKAMRGDRERCLSAGADGYVSKPVDIDLLLTEIRGLVKG